jgi:hypothetical protein
MSNGKLTRSITPIFAITLITVLTLSTFVMPAISYTSYVPHNPVDPPWHGMAFVYFRPDPIGVGQTMLCETWISPRPRYNEDFYYNYEYTFTKPSGAVMHKTVLYTEHPGSIWYEFVVDEVGEWKVDFYWAGYDTPSTAHPPLLANGTQMDWQWWVRNSENVVEDNEFGAWAPGISGDHEPISWSGTFTVQQDPVPNWPAAPLPTDGWDWPVFVENREWYQIMGYWPMSNYNSSKACFNPYTESVDSPHVLWTIPPTGDSPGGLIGGVYGTGQLLRTSGTTSIDAVAFGRGYDSTGGEIHCFDLRTGEMLFSVPGSFNYLTISRSGAQLIAVGATTLDKYDGWTGAHTHSSTHPRFVTQAFIDPYMTGLQVLDGGNITMWVKWDTTSNGANFDSRMIFNETFYNRYTGEGIFASEYELERGGDPNVVWTGDYNVMTYLTYPIYGESGAFDMWTGELLWHRYIEDFESRNSIGGGYDLVFLTEWPQHWNAFDTFTGERLWTGEEASYPWGNFWAYQVGVAYGMMYGISYDGYIRAYDIFGDYTGTPGAFVFSAFVGSTDPYSAETPYGTWPLYSGPVLGGETIIAATSEWGTPLPYYRGQRMHCFNAINGDAIWSLKGSWDPTVLAEGVLLAYNRYDGNQYAFGRGPSQIDSKVSSSVIELGDYTWISGTVTDQTPIMKGDPCLSKDSMGQYVEYKFFDQPKPTNSTGVPIQFFATDSNNNLITIGSTTSDAEGYFRFKWTPQTEDYYTITAYFAGDESYYSSYDIIGGLEVGPAAQATAEPLTAAELSAAVAAGVQGAIPSYPDVPTANEVANAVVNAMPEYPAFPQYGTPEFPAYPEPTVTDASAFTTADIAIIVLIVVAVVIGILSYMELRRRK